MNNYQWPYNIIAGFYDYDMALNMPFDDSNAYLMMMGKTPGKLLEIGAGNGRLTLPFLKAGWNILAIDRSQAMLDELIKKVSDSAYKNSITYLRSNVENNLILEKEYFDVVIMPYSIICYLNDINKTQNLLNSIYKSLKSNGILIVDAFIPSYDQLQTNKFSKDYLRQTPFGSIARYKRIKFNIKPNINLIERHYILNIYDEIKEYKTFSLIRPYMPEQLCKLISQSKFKILKKYYDYEIDNKNKINSANAKFFTLTAIKS